MSLNGIFSVIILFVYGELKFCLSYKKNFFFFPNEFLLSNFYFEIHKKLFYSYTNCFQMVCLEIKKTHNCTGLKVINLF